MGTKTSSWGAWFWAVLLTVAAGALAAYSTHLNWRYGQEFFGGDGRRQSLAFAAGFALIDGGKFIMAAQAATWWQMGRRWAACSLSILVFLGSVLSVVALINVGFQGAEDVLAEGRAERQTLHDLRARQADLTRQIDELGTTVPPSVIEHQMQALRRDRRWQSTEGCTNVTAAASRVFCANHDRLFAQLAAATKSERLQAEVAKLNGEIQTLTKADTAADPRRLMSIVASWLGLETDAVGFGQLLAFAIVLELFGVALAIVAGAQVASLRAGWATTVSPGTGVGGAPAGTQKRRQVNQSSRKRARRSGANGSAENDPGDVAVGTIVRPDAAFGAPRSGASELPAGTHAMVAGTSGGTTSSGSIVVPNREAGDSCPLAFWDHVIIPMPGARIGAGELYEAYQTWSLQCGRNPLPQASFGKALTSARGARRQKSNGLIQYVDVTVGPNPALPREGVVDDIALQHSVPDKTR